MNRPIKKYPTVGLCGLDCGLCPRYYTVGPSRCPGCCGPDFFNKHPSCSFITCCLKKKNLEICAECEEFPCQKFKEKNSTSLSERLGGANGDWWYLTDAGKYDSFLTYRKVVPNLGFIKEHGIKRFREQQRKRIELLETMLKQFDDGRSKSFYCLAVTLLTLESLENALDEVEKTDDIKMSAKKLKTNLNEKASQEVVELTLRKK